MEYTSTRNAALRISSAEAVSKGISDDGGLFVPVEFPHTGPDFIEGLARLDYAGRAAKILSLFMTDYSKDELEEYTGRAYSPSRFPVNGTAPVVCLPDGKNILELWHGPTCAFKDMALQILPMLLTGAAKKLATGMKSLILVATSGDTGKAALEGFRDVDGTRILVFYPVDGVSPMQKLQMTSQEGGNVGVCAVKGNFDDAQTAVKAIFTDSGVKRELAASGWAFSSANSINWGRLAPQIVYYFSAYCDLAASGKIRAGDPIVIDVPTGNFGDILAAYYAMKCGLPVKRFICASNQNDVLTEFLRTGVYNRNRPFHTTISPSMDILVSSNLERLLFDLGGGDDELIRSLFSSLREKGSYKAPDEMEAGLKRLFYAGSVDDSQTKDEIARVFENDHYLCDTHTAVACGVYEQYLADTGDRTPCVIASTADPYKFGAAVLSAVTHGKSQITDEWARIDELERLTGTKAPAALRQLRGRQIRFADVCDRGDMRRVVCDFAAKG